MKRYLVFLALLVILSILFLHCRVPVEGYADQVMHGIAGGIAGPILNDSLFDYDAPRYPLPPESRAIMEPTALWATPPEPPA